MESTHLTPGLFLLLKFCRFINLLSKFSAILVEANLTIFLKSRKVFKDSEGAIPQLGIDLCQKVRQPGRLWF